MQPNDTLADSTRLDTLPDDVLAIITSYLDVAQSVAHLARSCRRLHDFSQIEGWRVFVRNRFPSLSIPVPSSYSDWERIARDLTAHSRCWDRRGFYIDALFRSDSRQSSKGSQQARPRPQTTPYHSVVDAHLRISGKTSEEALVWGAGEDVLARFRSKQSFGSNDEPTWLICEGAKLGYKSGHDDITSLSVIGQDPDGQNRGLHLLVGRASGDLRLLSAAKEDFGRVLTRFSPRNTELRLQQQSEIQAVDNQELSGLLASASKTSVMLYRQLVDSQEEHNSTMEPTVAPSDIYDFSGSLGSRLKYLRSVKFLTDDMIAVGMTGNLHPLQYLKLSPTGLSATEASRNTDLEKGYSLRYFDQNTVRSLLPVNSTSVTGGQGSVVLSAWDDGTIRLQDVRTSSPFDRIYQDHFEPTTPANVLAAYGTERFIAGSARQTVLKIFDFRWDRDYYHTNALPCSNTVPFPEPKLPTDASPIEVHNGRACNYLSRKTCTWHALSQQDFYRPNSNIFLTNQGSQIHSLAKASDISSAIYIGVSGGIFEMNLMTDTTATALRTKPRKSKESRHPIDPRLQPMLAGMIETGDGIALKSIEKSRYVPRILKQRNGVFRSEKRLAWGSQHCRLDMSWFTDEDYRVPRRT